VRAVVAPAGDIDRETVLLQPPAKEGGGFRLVLDYQNPHDPTLPDTGTGRVYR
jgi:hypothetical protein